jgi:hypothetical protein
MDERKICGETKVVGKTKFVCHRPPHETANRKRMFDKRDGVFYNLGEPAPESHRMLGPSHPQYYQ